MDKEDKDLLKSLLLKLSKEEIQELLPAKPSASVGVRRRSGKSNIIGDMQTITENSSSISLPVNEKMVIDKLKKIKKKKNTVSSPRPPSRLIDKNCSRCGGSFEIREGSVLDTEDFICNNCISNAGKH